MSKKISTIFLSLFLVGILSVSCSNKDKTSSFTVDNSKGIEQFNGNAYASASAIMNSIYIWVLIKDGKVAIIEDNNNTSEPPFLGDMNVTGLGADYNFDSGNGAVAGTLKFSSDGSSVTIRFTKNTDDSSFENQDFVLYKK